MGDKARPFEDIRASVADAVGKARPTQLLDDLLALIAYVESARAEAAAATADRDEIDRLAWELSTYAAAVDWAGGGNSVGWLRGLQARIEAVQGHLRRTGRAGGGMVTEGPRLLEGRHDLAGGDWEVVTGQFDDGRWWWRIDGEDRTVDEGEADTEDEAREAAEVAMERDRG